MYKNKQINNERLLKEITIIYLEWCSGVDIFGCPGTGRYMVCTMIPVSACTTPDEQCANALASSSPLTSSTDETPNTPSSDTQSSSNCCLLSHPTAEARATYSLSRSSSCSSSTGGMGKTVRSGPDVSTRQQSSFHTSGGTRT